MRRTAVIAALCFAAACGTDPVVAPPTETLVPAGNELPALATCSTAGGVHAFTERPSEWTCGARILVTSTVGPLTNAIPAAINVWNSVFGHEGLPVFVTSAGTPGVQPITVQWGLNSTDGSGTVWYCGKNPSGTVITVHRAATRSGCGAGDAQAEGNASTNLSTLLAHELAHAIEVKHLSTPLVFRDLVDHCVASLPTSGLLNASLCQFERQVIRYNYGVRQEAVDINLPFITGTEITGQPSVDSGQTRTLTASSDGEGGSSTTNVRYAWTSSNTNVATVLGGTGATATVTGLKPGTTTITVRVNDGRYNLVTPEGTNIAFTVNGGAPPPPTGLNVTAITPNSATVRWTNGTGNVATVVEIRLSGATNWTTTPATAVGATSRVMTGLSAQTGYQVRAKHVAGTQSSAFTSPVSFTTAPILPPTGLNVTAITTNSATAGWTNGSSNVSTVVEIRLSGATNWTVTAPTAVGATSRVMSGLSSQTAYQIRAKHVDAVNTSAYTSVISFTTAVIPSPTITNFRVMGCEQRPSGGKTYNYFDLAWNASPAQDQGSYQVAMHHTNTVSLATVILTVPGTQLSGEVGGYLNSPTLMNRWFWVRYVRNGTPATPWVALNPSPLATNQCLL